MPRIVKSVCSHDCPDTCSVLITLDRPATDGSSGSAERAVQFRGNPEHPVTRGFLCGKVNNYERIVYNDERVLRPQRRVGKKGEARFEPVSWDDALTEIAEKIEECRREDGGESLLQHYYAGTLGVVNRNSGEALFNKLGATRLRKNICFFGAEAGHAAVVGQGHGVDPEDIVHSDLIIVWGSNVVTTQVHLVQFIDAARKKGARLLVIDPYRNRTAKIADEWIPVRPGTDTALALGLIHLLQKEGRLDLEFIEKRSVGFERLSTEVLPKYPAAQTAEITGVPEATIVDLARRIGQARAPVFKVGVGLGRSSHGGSAVRSICCLAGAIGAYDKLGGGVQYDTGGAFRINLEAVTRPDWRESRTRVLNMTDLAVALDEWDDPPIRFLWNHSANPMATSPLQAKLARAFEREDLFTVVHDMFLTDTARYADILLPAPTFTEYSDLYKSYGHFYLQYGARAIEPLGESRANYDVVQALATKLGIDDPWFELSVEDHVRALLDTNHPNLQGVDPDRVLAGEAVRLNIPRARPGFAERFGTPSGKLQFVCEDLEKAGHGVVDFRGDPFNTDPGKYPLRLITPPAHSFLNSSFAGTEVARRREKLGEPTALLHTSDAAAVDGGVETGDEIELFNELGSVRILARVMDEVSPGTVVVEGSWWPSHWRDGRGINVLTSSRLTDLGGGSTFHDNRVGIRKPGA